MELYVIGVYDDGELKRLVRKGRNHSIVGYDNLASANRGLGHLKGLNRRYDVETDYRILKADNLSEVVI